MLPYEMLWQMLRDMKNIIYVFADGLALYIIVYYMKHYFLKY